jgi:hypothetical protein
VCIVIGLSFPASRGRVKGRLAVDRKDIVPAADLNRPSTRIRR